MPLVYYGEKPAVPTLTVENYLKWYDIHVIYPDGRVEIVDHDLLDDAWSDHNFKPWVCHRIAKQTGFEWHDESLEMIIGRYVTECEQIPWYCDDVEPDGPYIYIIKDAGPGLTHCVSSSLDKIKRYYRSHVAKGALVELLRVADGGDVMATMTKLDLPARQSDGRTLPP